MGYNRRVLHVPVIFLLACSDSFSGDGAGGVWYDEDAAAPPALETATRNPQIGFLDPQYDEYFAVEQDVRVEILSGDADGGSLTTLTLSWDGPTESASELPLTPGVDGKADFTMPPLAIGDYTMTVTVVDPAGLSATSTVPFHVVAYDADGDGFEHPGLGGDDCNDFDAEINPGEVEVCNVIDDDCDALIDEEVTTTYWADADGDTFGDLLVPSEGCEAPPLGYVTNSDDCDDTTAERFPANPEVCDYLDNDCNFEVDEGVKTTYWRDVDTDGFGDLADPIDDCTLPAGYVENADDCLDTDATVSPLGTEVCYDNLDNDCDGTSNACGLGGDIDLSTSDAQYRGSASDNYAGTSVAGAGDWNNDGVDDMLVGAWGSDAGGSASGAVYVVAGGTLGIIDLDTSALARLTGGAAGDGAGWSVAGLGDWDADGQDDVGIGAIFSDGGGAESGAVYIVAGGGSGDLSLNSAATLISAGEAAGDNVGWSLGGGADLDGDGNADLVVGGTGSDSGGSVSGSAWIVQGGTSGVLNLSAAVAQMPGDSSGDQAGSGVALVGDANGDGLGDALVGALGDGTGGAGAGAAYLLYGPLSGSIGLGAADLVMIGENAGDQLGYAVSTAGDTNADGYDDCLLGAPYHDYSATDSGAAYVVLGGVRSGSLDLSAADAKAGGEGGDDGAGWSVAPAGDMDGDGDDDVLIGGALEDAGGTGAGAAYLMYGPLAALTSLALSDAKFIGEREGDYAGNSIASVGDVSGDGKGDVMVGAPYEDYGSYTRSGSAYLLLGQGL